MAKTVLSSPLIFGRFLRLLPAIFRSRLSGRFTVADLLEHWASAWGDKVFVRFEDGAWTYAQTNEYANRVAHYRCMNRQGGKIASLFAGFDLYQAIAH